MLIELLEQRTTPSAFASGDLVALRVEGTSTVASQASLFEYRTTGALVQNIALPVSGTDQFSLPGNDPSQGQLQRSVDQSVITAGGYNASPGTPGVASTLSAVAPREIARVTSNGDNGGIDTSTKMATAYSGSPIRAVGSDSGGKFWTAGGPSNGGTYMVDGTGASATTTLISNSPTNTNFATVANYQVYTAPNGGGISAVGPWPFLTSPTPGQATTPLVFAGGAPSGVRGFVFLDRIASVPGMDTLYVATSTGLRKYFYDLNNADWQFAGSAAGDIQAVTTNGYVMSPLAANNTVDLYCIVGSGAANAIQIFTDANNYNQPLNGSFIDLPNPVAASGTSVFRGLAFTPIAASAVNNPPIVKLNGTNGNNFTPPAPYREGAAAIPLEQSGLVPDSLNATVTDPDVGTNLQYLTVQILNPSQGDEISFSLAGTAFSPSDVVVNPLHTIVTFKHSLPTSEYQKLIRNIGFTNVSQNPDDSYTRNIAFQVNDGIDFSKPVFATARVIAVNNAPSVNVPFNQPLTTPEDNATFPSNGLRVQNLAYVDPDDTPPWQATPNIETLAIQLTDTVGQFHGTVHLPTVAGITFISGTTNDSAVMTIQGTKANLNTALAGLVVRPDRNYNGDLVLTLTPNDANVNDPTKGNYGTPNVTPQADPPLTGAPATVRITVTAVNDAPVITYNGPSPLPTNWNTTLQFNGANTISTSDTDQTTNPGGGTEVLVVDLQISAGVLSMDPNTFGGLSFSIGNGTNNNVMEFRGSIDAVNAALATLSYTPPANFTGTATLQMGVDDQGFFGAPGPLSASLNLPINVIQLNQAPTHTFVTPQFVAPGQTLTFSAAGGNAITVSDPDSQGAAIRTTLTVDQGTLLVPTPLPAGVTITSGANGTNTVTLHGPDTAITQALDGLQYLQPDNPPAIPYNVTLTLDSADFETNFPNGPQERTDTLTITVGHINDTPTITAPADQTALTGAATQFSPPISVADADAGTNAIQTVVTTNLGTLSVTGNPSVSVFGNGSGQVTIIGNQASINSALASLVFQAPAPGQATLTVSVDDLGNSGLGGARTASASFTVTVSNPVVAPIGQPDSYSTPFATPLSVPAPGVLANDTDPQNFPLTATLVSGPGAAGALDFNSDGSFTFTPASDFSGNAVFVYQASNGTLSTGPVTVTVAVAPNPGTLPPPTKPSIAHRIPTIYATGAQAGGGPHVKVFDAASGNLLYSFFAYDPSFTGGVRVATGDVNGDGVDDIIVAAGVGGGPHLKVFDGRNLNVLYSFYAFEPTFSGGVFVAAGDVNGDGYADLVVGAGPGGGPAVKVFSGRDGSLMQSFYAFEPTFAGGVHVATGDLDGDNKSDIVVGAASGGGPHVVAFRGSDLAPMASIFAFDSTFAGGVYVAAADVLGDGRAEIIVGMGNGGSPLVNIYDGFGNPLRSFNAFDPGNPLNALVTSDFPPNQIFTAGVTLGVAAVGGSSKADIIVAPGPGASSLVRAFDVSGSPTQLREAFAYDPSFLGGVYVGV